eukprot:4382367-Pleurochrysis_carterae.AAC.7
MDFPVCSVQRAKLTEVQSRGAGVDTEVNLQLADEGANVSSLRKSNEHSDGTLSFLELPFRMSIRLTELVSMFHTQTCLRLPCFLLLYCY